MGTRLRAGGAALLAGWVALMPSVSLAKCAMCARNVDAAGSGGAGTGPLLGAALVLLVPTVGVLTGFVILLWKQRERAVQGRLRSIQ